MPQPPSLNEDVSDKPRWAQVRGKWGGLDLAPHQAFEVALSVEALDVGKATDRALVDEDIRDGLPVHTTRELLKRDARRAAGRVDNLEAVASPREEPSGASNARSVS
jgi:hypothetical protein